VSEKRRESSKGIFKVFNDAVTNATMSFSRYVENDEVIHFQLVLSLSANLIYSASGSQRKK
jgi:hypothetical protein